YLSTAGSVVSVAAVGPSAEGSRGGGVPAFSTKSLTDSWSSPIMGVQWSIPRTIDRLELRFSRRSARWCEPRFGEFVLTRPVRLRRRLAGAARPVPQVRYISRCLRWRFHAPNRQPGSRPALDRQDPLGHHPPPPPP